MKICLIGCGGQAIAAYMPSLIRYKKENEHIIYAGCCDVDLQKATEFKEKTGFTSAYSDHLEMMEREKPDAVILVTPFIHTAKIVLDILDFKPALMIEKPLGENLVQCMEIAEACEKKNIFTQTAFNRRHIPLIRELMKDISSDPFPIQHIDYKMHRVNRTESHFHTTAVHGIDLVGYIAGSDYHHVQFAYQKLKGFEKNNIANTYMQCEFKSGTTAHLSFCPVSGLVSERIEVMKDHQIWYVNLPIWKGPDSPGSIIKYENGKMVYNKSGLVISDGIEMFEDNGFYCEVKEFIDTVRNAESPKHSIRTAIDSMKIMDCMKSQITEV